MARVSRAGDPSSGRAWKPHKMADLPTVRFAMRDSRMPPQVVRPLVVLAIVLSFVPGIWIVVGAVAVGPDRSVALVGLVFLAGAAGIWLSVRRIAREVTIAGDRLTWHGHLSDGTCALGELRTIRPARWPRGGLTFELAGGRGFEVLPARGIDVFLEAVARLRPGLYVEVPRGMRWAAHFYGTAEVTVSGSAAREDEA